MTVGKGSKSKSFNMQIVNSYFPLISLRISSVK